MSKDLGKISPEDFPNMEDLPINTQATAFCNGFCQGFLSSFQGFNGETFKEASRPLMESENFRNNMAAAFSSFLTIMSEMEAMMAIEKGQRLN